MKENSIPDKVVDNLFESLADGVSEGVYYVTTNHVILFWNKKAEMLTGYTRLEVTGMSCSDSIFHDSDESNCGRCSSVCPLSATLKDGHVREVDAFLHKKSGERMPARVRCSPVRNREGTILGAIEVFTEKTQVLETNEEVEKLRREASTDPLTGAGNRRLVALAIRQFQQGKRSEQIPFGVIFFDIDHFKAFNDTWGHDTGDLVLRETARVVRESLRKQDLLCRWGGEEFVVLVPECSEGLLVEICERIRYSIQEARFRVKGQDLHVTVSVGGALHFKGERVRKTIARADDLMYEAKKAGRNQVST